MNFVWNLQSRALVRAAALGLAACLVSAGARAGPDPGAARPVLEDVSPAVGGASLPGAEAPSQDAGLALEERGAEGAERAPEDAEPAPAAAEPAPADPASASAAEDFLAEYEDVGASDPLEPTNRMVFGANEAVYQNVFDPIATGYALVVPKPVRRSVLRFFENLGEPANFLNEVLQLNPVRAGKTGARFFINSTVGVVGLFDPARRIGIGRNSTDFGETLGVYGIGEGWYLVVPILGPSSVRDLFGDMVNAFFHPQTYFLAYAPQAILATSSGFSRYEASRRELEALRDSSVDFYVALRSAYLQQREADVREARSASPVLRPGEPDVAADGDGLYDTGE